MLFCAGLNSLMQAYSNNFCDMFLKYVSVHNMPVKILIPSNFCRCLLDLLMFIRCNHTNVHSVYINNVVLRISLY